MPALDAGHYRRVRRPLVSLTGLDTCGINLSGMSSSGKSTAQLLAATAWSTPDLRKPGLCQSARATDNAVEALASRANGTVLSLDELAHVPGKQAAKMIYTIAGGVGKRRMTADATIRDSYTWSTFALLSAESSLEEKITSDGGEWMAGMAVRIPDVTVTGINRNVPRQLMDRIAGIDRNYGHAGPAFVKAIVTVGLHKAPIQLRDQVTAKQRDIAGENADSATLRAAPPFALIALAGALAQSVGVLPKTMDVPGAVFSEAGGALARDLAFLDCFDLIPKTIWPADRVELLVKAGIPKPATRFVGAPRAHANSATGETA